MTGNHRRLARGSRHFRITAIKVILSALTARLLAVPTRMQAALPVPKSARVQRRLSDAGGGGGRRGCHLSESEWLQAGIVLPAGLG